MNSLPESRAGLSSVEQTRQHIQRLVEEITRLTEASPPAGEFYAEFLHRVLTALDAPAGAIWDFIPPGPPQLLHQINLAAIGLDKSVNGQACHEALLGQVAQLGRPRLVGPWSEPGATNGTVSPANHTGHALLLAPILREKQAVGVVEVWQEPDVDWQGQAGFLQFLQSMADFVAAYQRQAQLRELLARQELWTRLESFGRQIHASLHPREVACLVANDGLPLVGCDRLSVVVRLGSAVEVEAISGADVVDRRGRLVRLMQQLADRVLAWGDRLVYTGNRDDSIPPPVLEALDAYLAESHSQMLVLLPLRDERDGADGQPGRSALLAECFEAWPPVMRLTERLEVVGRQAAPALYNAVEHRRIPLRWLWLPLAGLRDRLRGRRWAGAAALAMVLASLVGALALIPYPLRLEAEGQLLPRERQLVFAPIHGKIVQVRSQQGDRVARDQELLLMEDLDLQEKVKKLEVGIAAAQAYLAAVGERLNQTTNDEERYQLKLEQIKHTYERRKAEVERDVLLHQTRKPLEAPVVAPRAGTVVTFDAHEQLLGKTVKPGDPLLRIARLDGPWEVELQIPERHVGPVRQALASSAGASLPVEILLASQPDHTYQGSLHGDGLGGEATLDGNAVVLPAHVEITDPELLAQVGRMPVGVRVRARIRCGSRPVGYAWFRELWEFLYEHVLF